MRLTKGQVALLAAAEAGKIMANPGAIWLADRPGRVDARVYALVGKGLLRRIDRDTWVATYVLTDAGRAELDKRRRP